ncbi:MAG: TonB-dependent receptor domain-containing protein [Gemmatimonadota bacterium]
MRGIRAALLAVVGLGFAVGASAQSATTGQIRGQVHTPEGEPLEGASVTATNVATGQQRGTLTNSNGAYLLLLLPPGEYAVEVAFIGYEQAEASRVRVALGNTSTANFTLRTRAIDVEGVRVTADRTQVDVSDASVMELVSEEQIQGLPAPGRDFTDFIQLSGLVAPDPAETTGGQFSIAGQRASQTNLQIDGVDANNAFFGENRGGSRIPFVFSLESIKEFQVIANGFDVEYGSYSGGIVNVITRGGTNDWGGSAYLNYQSDALTGEKFADYQTQDVSVEDYEVMQFAGSLSGPIIRDKAFFLFSVDGQRRREPQVSITQEEFSDSLPTVAGEVGEFFDILENEYGVTDARSTYGSFQTTNDVLTVFGRVDWNLTDAHRLSLRHNFANYSNDNEWNPRYDYIYGLSRAEEYVDVSHSFVTELQSVFGPQTFNVARFQFSDESRPRTGKDLRPELRVNLSEGRAIAYGGTFAAFQNDLEERKLQFINNLTHVVGDHTLKVGVNVIQTTILNQFILEGAGAYNFPDLNAFRNMQPSSYTRNIRAGGGIPISEFGVREWGVYAQDEWLVTPRLTATLGIRYDVQSFLDDPARVLNAERAFGVETGIAPTDNNNISPRLALAYDLSGNGSSVVRAGVGYFYGRVPYVLGGNVQSTVRPVVEVSCAGDPGDPDAPPSPADYGDWGTYGSENPVSCTGTTVASGIPEYTFWNEDFQFPETLKANLGYETEIGERTRFSADLLFSQSTNLYTVRNLNMRDVQFTLENEGGRQVFQPVEVFDPGVTDGVVSEQRTRRNLELGNVFVNYNDGRARSIVATAEVVHNLTEDMQVRGSYTYTDSKDNSSYSCCTAHSGFTNPTIGAYGPNDIGGIGATDKAWGPSDFTRDHTFILSLDAPIIFGLKMGAFWRLQSGRPWTPEARGDLNGDGVLYNDRPFIFAPEDLPLDPSLSAEDAAVARADYERILDENACVGDYVGQIIPRNTCRFPWYNRLDVRLSRSFATFEEQRAEFQIDLFNVLNGLNREWGTFTGVFSADRNLLLPQSYDAETGQSYYDVPSTFGRERVIGDNLQLQFQARVGLKYYF